MADATTLRRGPLSVVDYRCTAGPSDEPFVERHESFAVSYVRKGSFGYRLRGQSFELVAGSVLVGYPGDEYICTHDHAHGDECLSFHFTPDAAETFGDSHDDLARRLRAASARADGPRRAGAGHGRAEDRPRDSTRPGCCSRRASSRSCQVTNIVRASIALAIAGARWKPRYG